MTRRKKLCWLFSGLAALVLAAFAAPYAYWGVVGLKNRDAFFRCLPTTFWRGSLVRYEEWRDKPPDWSLRCPDRVLRLLGFGAEPAILQGDPDAMPVLLDLLRDEASWSRTQACNGLRVVDRPEAECALLGALLDPDESVRFHATSCFRWDRRPVRPQAVAALCAVLERGDVHSRNLAAYCLFRLGPDARAAVPLLLRDRDHADGQLRVTVVLALRQINPARPAEVPAPEDGHDEEG